MTINSTHRSQLAARGRPASPRVSIVIPAKNEARNLTAVLPTLPTVHEVILVDGNSEDDTVAAARSAMPDIKVVQQTRRGKGNALVCGFRAVTGDIVVMFDADGSADAREIPRFVDALVRGADFAKGSRFCDQGGSSDITWFRTQGNDFLNGVTNILFDTRFTDLCYGYNAFWADIVPDLDLPCPSSTSDGAAMQWGDGFEIESLLNCRVAAAALRIAEVPSHELPRIHGESNLNAIRDGFRVLRTIWSEHRRARKSQRGQARATQGAAGLSALRHTAHVPSRVIDLREVASMQVSKDVG